MTRKARGQDLAADLMQDLTARPATDAPGDPGPRDPGSDGPHPALETALYLSPRGWRRPAVTSSGSTVTVQAGPVRITVRRGRAG